MNTRTPADWKALFESDAFAQQNTYTGPLGVEYTPAGTRLRLWAPTARQVYVNLYRQSGGRERQAEHDRRFCPNRPTGLAA